MAGYFQQHNIVWDIRASAGQEECMASRGSFSNPFARKCATSVRHPLVVYLFYSTLHWPFCKIMIPFLSAHLLPVSNLSERILSASIYRPGPGEALAVIMLGHSAADRIWSTHHLPWQNGCTSGTVYKLFPEENAPLNLRTNLNAGVHLEVWLVCIFKPMLFVCFMSEEWCFIEKEHGIT